MTIFSAVFEALDRNVHEGLWVTDRTTIGTTELSPAGANSQGIFFSGSPLFSPDFTVLAGKALFEGFDAGGHYQLWVTDGTSAGTSELAVAGASPAGLFDSELVSYFFPDLTVLGNKVLFEGADTSTHSINRALVHNLNLWVTDGTSSGTSELTVAGASADGLSPTGFTVFGSRALFEGLDVSNHPNVWVTDGTAAGTNELVVAGASFLGLLANNANIPPDFTVFGTKALFVGQDANAHYNLWITDGTSAGTNELTGLGANPAGLFNNFFVGNAPDFTVLGSKVLFEGDDASNHLGLWVTDGTSAGTSALAAVGAYSGGLFGSPEPAFTVLGRGALFEGRDTNGNYNLWVTDGTSVGTSELPVAGASASGLFFNVTPNFTVLGKKVLFAGRDTNNKINLWETDGTVSGTSELVVGGASVNGLLSGSNPDFTVVGGRALFEGASARGGSLWVTDGTSAGTKEVFGAFLVGGSFIAPMPSDITVLSVATTTSPRDFDGDGNSDLLFQNSSGPVVIWEQSGAMVIASGSAGNPGPGWRMVGTGDFNDDGKSDILFQNSTGQVVIWEQSGATVIASGSAGNPGPSWHAVATGDFNGDGLSDILFQNSSGEIVIWEMSGATVIASGDAGNPGPSWHVVGTGDFNGDGRSDILFQNSSGEIVIWEMSGASIIASGDAGNPGPSWHAVGVGDFTGDGLSDILFQNDNGAIEIWAMSGASIIASGSPGNPGPTWHVVGTGDYNGDGRADVRFQNSDGAVEIWEMSGASIIASGSAGNPGPSWHLEGDSRPYAAGNADLLWQNDRPFIFLQNDDGQAFAWATNGAAVTGGGSPGNPGPSWHAKASGDFNADGSPDILWQNDSGEAAVWTLSGATRIGGGSIGNPGPSWHVVGSGDFNGDGFSDVLWQNDDGSAAIWEMNGTTVLGSAVIGNPGPSWHVIGSGDFNRDGFSDILWQNDDGSAAIWEMSGTTVLGSAVIGNPGPSWQVKGTGDFNGDGFSDILWQNDDGSAAIWEMNGTTPVAEANIGNPGPGWHIIGTGDYNNDGKSDILWQNSNGAVAVWEMNGTTPLATAVITNPGPTWHA